MHTLSSCVGCVVTGYVLLLFHVFVGGIGCFFLLGSGDFICLEYGLYVYYFVVGKKLPRVVCFLLWCLCVLVL